MSITYIHTIFAVYFANVLYIKGVLRPELDTAARDRYLATKYRGPGQLGAGARRKADNGSDMESGYSSHRESKDTSEFWCSSSFTSMLRNNIYSKKAPKI